jgi:hypothetical protein
VHVEQGDGVGMILYLLRKGVGQARKSAHL